MAAKARKRIEEEEAPVVAPPKKKFVVIPPKAAPARTAAELEQQLDKVTAQRDGLFHEVEAARDRVRDLLDQLAGRTAVPSKKE